MNFNVGFIGAGNMGSALAVAASKSNAKIFLYDLNAEKAKETAEKTGSQFSDIKELISNCKFIFLGVKPQVLPSLLNEIKNDLKSKKDRFILVSMAAGTPIKTISECLGFECPVIRIMPNLPVSLGEGVVLRSDNGLVNKSELEEFDEILSKSGIIIPIDEKMIDAGCAVSGCGPAFVYMFIEALADGGVACGLPYNMSLQLAAQTLIGASKMVLSSDCHPGKLRSDVCSPGGTTIEGVKVLEENNIRFATMEAVIAAYKRSKELAK